MAYIDYYKVLGIDKKASEKDIKNSYRKLARKYHPDLNPNNKEANKNFQQINEANEVLSNAEKRKKYDLHGEHWQHAEEYEQAQKNQKSRRPGPSAYDYESSGQAGDFSDFFESMFGNSGGPRRGRETKYRGQDYQSELHLNLQDTLQTHTQILTVNGKNIRITIPAGIENGQTIKIPAHGAAGKNGGPPGDLLITFFIKEDVNYKRDGKDLYTIIPLDLYIAVLGGEITIETLTGKVKVKVKPETQSGTRVKLKGKGMPVYKKENEFGDLYITYQVKVPVDLTERQKELFKELSES